MNGQEGEIDVEHSDCINREVLPTNAVEGAGVQNNNEKAQSLSSFRLLVHIKQRDKEKETGRMPRAGPQI